MCTTTTRMRVAEKKEAISKSLHFEKKWREREKKLMKMWHFHGNM